MKKVLVSFMIYVLTFSLTESTRATQQQEMMEGELRVAEAKLGKDVVDREIADETSTFAVNDRVYLWLKVTGGSADSVAVTWKHEDLSYSYTLKIGGSPWRTWAYKTAWKAGDWTVIVTDSDDNVLKEMNFKVEGLAE
ncbi:MAG: DUF2914 domain-containing protein [Bacteroidota bacterium]